MPQHYLRKLLEDKGNKIFISFMKSLQNNPPTILVLQQVAPIRINLIDKIITKRIR